MVLSCSELSLYLPSKLVMAGKSEVFKPLHISEKQGNICYEFVMTGYDIQPTQLQCPGLLSVLLILSSQLVLNTLHSKSNHLLGLPDPEVVDVILRRIHAQQHRLLRTNTCTKPCTAHRKLWSASLASTMLVLRASN